MAAPSTPLLGKSNQLFSALLLHLAEVETRGLHRERLRRRGRYVPAAERREVFEHDGGRCSYADSHGGRCRETRYLELHHVEPFGLGGANLASNLTLRCAAHNALAAEEDFDREPIEQKRDQARHESLAARTVALRNRSSAEDDPPTR